MNCIYTQKDLERVTDQYSVMVYRLAYALVKSKSEAEDVYQDVFLTLMNENPVFPLVRDERDYIIKETIESARRHKAAKHYQPDPVKMYGQEVKDEKEGYLLDSMLHGVRKRSILMMHLSVVEGISQKEIGEIVSCRKGKVRRVITRTAERMEKNEKERQERRRRVHKRMLEDRREELMKVTYHEVYPTLFQNYKVEGEDDTKVVPKDKRMAASCLEEETGMGDEVSVKPALQKSDGRKADAESTLIEKTASERPNSQKAAGIELSEKILIRNQRTDGAPETEEVIEVPVKELIEKSVKNQEQKEAKQEKEAEPEKEVEAEKEAEKKTEIENRPPEEQNGKHDILSDMSGQEDFDEAQTIKISIEKIKREREKQKKEVEQEALQNAEQARKEQQEAQESVASTDTAVLGQMSPTEHYQKLYENIVPSVFLKNEIMCHLLEILYERICRREEERIKQERIRDKERGIYRKQKSPNGEYQNISIVKPARLVTGGKAVLLAALVCVLISAPAVVFAISYDNVISYIGTTVKNYFKPIGTSAEEGGITMKVLKAIQDGESAVFYVEVKDEEGRFDGEIALKDYTITSLNSFSMTGVTKISDDTSIIRFVAKDWDGSISSQVRLNVQSILSGITRYDDFLVQEDLLRECSYVTENRQILVDSRAVIEENGEGYEIILGERNWSAMIPCGWEEREQKKASLEQQGVKVDEKELKQIEREQETPVSQSISEAYLSGIGIIDGNLHIQVDWGNTYHTGSFYLMDGEGEKLYPYMSFRFDMDDKGKMKAGSTYEEYIFLTEGKDVDSYELVASDFIKNDVCIDGDWKVNFKVSEATGSIDLTTKGKIYGAKLHKFTITPAKIVIRGTYTGSVSRIRVDIVSKVEDQAGSDKKNIIEKILSSNLLSKLNLFGNSSDSTDVPSNGGSDTAVFVTPTVITTTPSAPSSSSSASESAVTSSPSTESETSIKTQTSTYLYVMAEDDEETFTLSWTPTLPITLKDIVEVYLNGSLVYEHKD
ncbi:MAG: hypothetical protein E7256_13635 [Lachnospiraceae bacterium]|nr:hypothetical protein [Lachnospiraceae bacterium]